MIVTEELIRQVQNTLARLFIEKLETICPDEKIRLKFMVGTHFVERMFQRIFDWQKVRPEIISWIDREYCVLLFEANLNPNEALYRKVELSFGTIIISIFNKEISFRTCYKEKYERVSNRKCLHNN